LTFSVQREFNVFSSRLKHSMSLRAGALVGILSAILILGTGCGSGKVPVSGMVTLDGKPLPEGRLYFFDEKGLPTVDDFKEGRFAFQLTPGTKRVEIRAFELINPPPPAPYDPKRNYLPARYNTNSTLRAEIPASGMTDLHFELQSH
jgi:hypothetical protein